MIQPQPLHTAFEAAARRVRAGWDFQCSMGRDQRQVQEEGFAGDFCLCSTIQLLARAVNRSVE